MLWRTPGFSLLAVVLLGVGIGLNVAIFAVADAVMLRAFPYPQARRLVDIAAMSSPVDGRPGAKVLLEGTAIAALQDSMESLAAVAAYSVRRVAYTDGRDPRRLKACAMSAAAFDVLRVAPVVGRRFLATDERSGADPVVIISYSLWQERFAGDPLIAGRLLRLDDVGHVVVGIMPAGFWFPPEEIDVWTVLPVRESHVESAVAVEVGYFPVIARLAEGVSTARAEAEAAAVIRQAAATRPLEGAPRIRLTPLRDEWTAQARPALALLGVAAAIVFLCVCSNLASLLLVRNLSRSRELAIRLALGASRGGLVGQLLLETAVVALIGGSAGVAMALWLRKILPPLVPSVLGGMERTQIDASALVYAGAVCIVAVLLVAVVPAIRGLPVSVSQSLQSGAAEKAGGRSRSVLIAVQVALAFVLASGSALLTRSFVNLSEVSLGFAPRELLLAPLELDPRVYGEGRAQSFVDALLARMEGHPGVQSVGVVSTPPLSSQFALTSVNVVGEPRRRSLAVHQLTSPGYFEAMGFALEEGRWLRAEDERTGARVAVVNQTFANRYIGGGKRSGRWVEIRGIAVEIVGVVRDARLLGPASEARPEVYTSFRLAGSAEPLDVGNLTVAARGTAEGASLVPVVRSLIRELDPNLPLGEIDTMEARLAAAVSKPRSYALLMGVFALVAVGLSAAGIYGVLSFHVTRQTRAIAVRRALGAQRGEIMAEVMARGLLVVLAGVFAGVMLSFWGRGLLSHMLFEVSAEEPFAYAAAASLLAFVGACACYFPARRATRVEPLEALRSTS